MTGARKTQFNTLRDKLLHTGTDQAPQMLAVAEHFDAVWRRGILMHLPENRF
ncbi:hypothetical protein D3C86_2167380 [compost metagenome]